jgi:hypothetical protein
VLWWVRGIDSLAAWHAHPPPTKHQQHTNTHAPTPIHPMRVRPGATTGGVNAEAAAAAAAAAVVVVVDAILQSGVPRCLGVCVATRGGSRRKLVVVADGRRDRRAAPLLMPMEVVMAAQMAALCMRAR